VDPEYDTVQVLNSYAKLHGALSGKWYFLTGEKEKLRGAPSLVQRSSCDLFAL
jgi:cytochrome oxidase Cu insertion factor (SCO1/SenC/PrrC family)